MCSCAEDSIFGPGHNSFTVTDDPDEVPPVYHARTYRRRPAVHPRPLHVCEALRWSADGMPLIGQPSRHD
jgi:GH43 family beta-xylosidase